MGRVPTEIIVSRVLAAVVGCVSLALVTGDAAALMRAVAPPSSSAWVKRASNSTNVPARLLSITQRPILALLGAMSPKSISSELLDRRVLHIAADQHEVDGQDLLVVDNLRK